MGNTCYDRIIDYRENYAYNYANRNRKPVYVQSPSILLTFFSDNNMTDSLNKTVSDTLSNPIGAKLIDCTKLGSQDIMDEIKSAVMIFNDNAGSFNNMNEISVFAVGNAECMHGIDMNELFLNTSEIFRGVLRGTIVCIIDELSRNNTLETKNVLDSLENCAHGNKVFVLGRKKLNGKIPGIQEAKDDYINIICELIFNSNSLTLSNGIYSAGYTSIHSILNAYWSSTLSNYDIDIEEKVQVNGKKDSIISEVEQCISAEYSIFNVPDLKCVIKNSVGGINPSADIETIVKAIYGDALDVYLEYKRNTLSAIINKKSDEIKAIISEGSIIAINNLRAAIQNKSDIFYANTGVVNNAYEYLDTDNVSEIEKRVYDNYLLKKLEEFKNIYTQSLFKLILDIIDGKVSHQDTTVSGMIDEKKAVAAYTTNFNNTSIGVMDSYSGALRIFKQDSYIDSLCGSINSTLVENHSFNTYFEEQTGNALSYLYGLSEPYCVNSVYNIKKSLFLIGDTSFSKLLSTYDSSIVTLGNSHNDFDGILTCTSINMQEYRHFLNL